MYNERVPAAALGGIVSRHWEACGACNESQDRRFTFDDHEIGGAKLTDEILRRLRFSNDLREVVVALVRHHLIVYTPSWTDAAVRRWINRVTPQLTGDVLALARADVVAKNVDAQSQLDGLAELERRVCDALTANQAFVLKDLAVTGDQLMQGLNIAPGPAVGRLLRDLMEDVLETPGHNERERLLERARELLKSSLSDASNRVPPDD